MKDKTASYGFTYVMENTTYQLLLTLPVTETCVLIIKESVTIFCVIYVVTLKLTQLNSNKLIEMNVFIEQPR